MTFGWLMILALVTVYALIVWFAVALCQAADDLEEPER